MKRNPKMYSWWHTFLLLLYRTSKSTLLSKEFEQYGYQEFERVLLRGHHMLEDQEQSVNMTRSMGGPKSI